MTPAILVGSRAAHLRGCLPPWRNGRMVDWDIHARPDVIEGFAQRRPDLRRINRNFVGRGLWVSFFQWGAVSDALAACDDNEPVEVFDIPALCISPASQIALKAAYRHATRRHAAKTASDLDHWIATFDRSSWRPCHDAVFEAMRERAKALFDHPDPGAHPWRSL